MKAVAASREGAAWRLELRPASGAPSVIRAKVLVNAAGPWARSVQRGVLRLEPKRKMRLVKGSHIAVPRTHPGDHAFIFQNCDRRAVFAIPYEGRFTLIGTTDIAFDGDPGRVEASSAEIEYLCGAVSRFFRMPVSPGDVVWSYSGVRPLFDDGAKDPQTVTRDYAFDLDAPPGAAPALTIFGGKITTFRRLSEQVMERLRAHFPAMGPAWTERAKLPGGDIENGDFAAFAASVAARWPFLAAETAHRLARAYGTRVDRILGGARSMADLGRDFGLGLTEAELDYLARDEWARTPDDALWRRTKLGLHLTGEEAQAVASYFGERQAA